MRTLLIGALATLLSASFVHAQTPPAAQSPAYRYLDDAGGIHWAQSIHLVPPAYASRATMPNFRDPSVFPPAPPYVKPTTPSAIALSIPHQPRLESLHGRWAGEARRLIAAAWKGHGQDGPQPTLGVSVLRDGRLNIPDVERSSGDLAYDLKARDALIALRRLPPLPAEFPGMQLRVQLGFAHVR